MTSLRRNYTVKLFTLDQSERGKITLDQDVIYYKLDRNTQNLYLITDEDVDCDIELVFDNYRVQGEKVEARSIEFMIPYQYLQTPGIYDAQFILTRGDKAFSSDSFVITVRNGILGGDK